MASPTPIHQPTPAHHGDTAKPNLTAKANLAAETPLALKRRARRVYRVLTELYPDAHCELDHRDAFQLLVATVLSAQTTDVRVNAVTPALFAQYPDPASLAQAAVADVSEIIRPTGFFRSKAENIVRLAQQLVVDFDGVVPRTLAELTRLPGVGRKTANVVLGNAFGVPGITVDTHFGRISRRMDWTDSQDPVVVEQEVGALFPRRDWTELSHRMIFHGRRTCHSRRPACGACAVARWCPSSSIGETDPVVAQQLLKPATAAQQARELAARQSGGNVHPLRSRAVGIGDGTRQ